MEMAWERVYACMLCLATTYPKPATEAERDFNIAQFGVKKKPQGYSSDISIACAVLQNYPTP